MTRIERDEKGYIRSVNTGAGRGLEPDFVEWFPDEVDFEVMWDGPEMAMVDEYGNLKWKLEPDSKNLKQFLGPIVVLQRPTADQIESYRVFVVRERINQLGGHDHEFLLLWERIESGETRHVKDFRNAVAQIKTDVESEIEADLALRDTEPQSGV